MAYLPLLPQRPIRVQEIYTVHYFEYAGSYAFSGESHDFWELLYVDRGSLRVTAGDQVWELTRGQIIFHAPGEFHALSATGWPRIWWWSALAATAPIWPFSRDSSPQREKRSAPCWPVLWRRAPLPSPLPLDDPATQTLQRREVSPFGGEQLVCAALEELLIRLIRRREQPRPHSPPLEATRASSGWPPIWSSTWTAPSPWKRSAGTTSSAAASCKSYSTPTPAAG